MEITRIKKAKVEDTILYVLGIGVRSDYEKRKLDKFIKELNEKGIVPVEKLESFFEDNFAFLVSKVKVNSERRKYEFFIIACGNENRVKEVIESLKEYIKK